MVETLSTTRPYFINYGKYSEFPISITEPDNGHRSEHSIKLDLTDELQRLQTFDNWKCEAVTKEALAKAGFYFLNRSSEPDLVKCAFCNVEVCRWENDDDPLEEHLKWSPGCRYAKNKYESIHGPIESSTNVASGQDVCGHGEIFTNSIPENETFALLSNLLRNNVEVKNTAYVDKKARLESFANFPKSSKQNPELLAEAGFYYAGSEDKALCFSCGGGLGEWKDDDDPWEQHALWFPNCMHLLVTKGAEYVETIRHKFASTPTNSKAKEENQCGKSVVSVQSHSPPKDGVLLCQICDSNERNTVFNPCRHILTCYKCARQLDKCPVCRSRIDSIGQVFLS